MLLPQKAKESIEAENAYRDKSIKTGIWKKREVDFIAGEIIIKINPGKARDSAFIEKLFSGDLKNAKVEKQFDRFGIGLVDVGDKADVLKICETLNENSEIEYAEPNIVGTIATTIPNDPDYFLQWTLPQIKAPDAWDIETGNSNVLIAVLDTGIAMDGTPLVLSHPDLNDPIRIILGHDHVNDDVYPKDNTGHGTAVAGIVSAQTNNGIGIAGVSWGSKLYVIKIFGEKGRGPYLTFYNGIIEAVDYAATHGYRLVINISGGGFSPSETLEKAVKYAKDNNCLIVAAAGNEKMGPVAYPAAYSASYNNVIAVSATEFQDNFATYSSKGPEVNVSAPGTYVYTTLPNYHVILNEPEYGGYKQNYDFMYGTSMAAPHISGLAALLLSYNNGLSAEDVRDIIERTVDDLGTPGWDEYYGYGRIDALAALEYLKFVYDHPVIGCRNEVVMCNMNEVVCPKESYWPGCWKEGVLVQVPSCRKEGVLIQVPGEEVIYPLKYKYLEKVSIETANLKHIMPLTKRSPLSHKKRYYPKR